MRVAIDQLEDPEDGSLLLPQLPPQPDQREHADRQTDEKRQNPQVPLDLLPRAHLKRGTSCQGLVRKLTERLSQIFATTLRRTTYDGARRLRISNKSAVLLCFPGD